LNRNDRSDGTDGHVADSGKKNDDTRQENMWIEHNFYLSVKLGDCQEVYSLSVNIFQSHTISNSVFLDQCPTPFDFR